MAVTTPNTKATRPLVGHDEGYDTPDSQPRGRGDRDRLAKVLVVILVVALVPLGWWLVRSAQRAEPATTTSTTESPVTTTTATTPSTTATTPSTTAAPPLGYGVGGDLIDYVTKPIFYAPGTAEGDVEVAYVNSVIATSRALANPSVEEPQVAFWQTGYALAATRQTQGILKKGGQVIVQGPLSRIEIPNITVRSETEADLEYCELIHDYNSLVSNPTDKVEHLGTLHAIERLTKAPDGHWQASEKLQTIEDVKGIGSCLHLTLTPATIPLNPKGGG